jgi:hypothetical protein
MESNMQTELTLSSSDALEAMKLISEYLRKGGTGFDDEALARVYDALIQADKIIISNES